MRIVQALPPLFDEIDAVFHVSGRPILFAWGDKIFNPMGVFVPPEIVVHEEVHGARQGGDIVAWWRRYVADPEFRLAEELPAHVAELRSLCDQHRPKWQSERNLRRTMAGHVARKLAAPLYGNLITIAKAKQLLLAA